jgi:hypothetical protein
MREPRNYINNDSPNSESNLQFYSSKLLSVHRFIETNQLKLLYIFHVHDILASVSIITLFVLGIVTCMSLFVIVFTANNTEASNIRNITAMNGSVWYAGNPVGSIHVDLNDIKGPGSFVNITANITKDPSPGKVFEGWLHDPKIFSTYDLNLGVFLNNTLRFEQFMNNPDIYKYFVVSEEPVGDINPRMSDVIVGGVQVDLSPDSVGDIIGGGNLSLPEYRTK